LAEGRLTVTWRKLFDHLLALSADDPEAENGDSGGRNRRHSVKSGRVYAYGTSWVDAGADWDEQKVAEFAAVCDVAIPGAVARAMTRDVTAED
jgi:hypothetical protein